MGGMAAWLARARLEPATTLVLGLDTLGVGRADGCSGLAGLPAVSMLSLRSNAFSDYHLPTDTPDRVDWGSVDRCLAIVEATCRLAP